MSASWNGCHDASFLVFRWAECYPGVAAWLQALLISIPVFLWVIDRRDRRRELYDRTCSFVVGLAGAIYLLDSDLSRVEALLQRCAEEPPDGPTIQQWFENATLRIPLELSDSSEMHSLQGNIVAPFRDVVICANAYNGYMERFSIMEMSAARRNWPSVQGQMSAQIAMTRRFVDQAMKMIETATVSDEPQAGGRLARWLDALSG